MLRTVVGLLALLALTGCTGPDVGPPVVESTATGAPSVVPSAVPPRTEPASPGVPSASAAANDCRAWTVAYADDPGGAGAGSVYGHLSFDRPGAGPRCDLVGYPQVSYADQHHHRIGAPAAPDPGATPNPQPGGRHAAAALRRTSPGGYGPECQPTPAAGLLVTLPGDGGPDHFVRYPATACANPKIILLTVGPITGGRSGPHPKPS